MNSPRERDQSVERLLRQSRLSLQAHDDRLTEPCLDAETLAAWVDGGLSGEAQETAQSHVADCGRCQALVGTLARINSGVPQAVPERASRRWLAWLVPLTAVAATVAIWVAVPHDKYGGDAGAPVATDVQKQAFKLEAQEPARLDGPSQAPASGPPGKEERVAQAGSREAPPPSVAERTEKKDAAGLSETLAKAAQLRRDAAPASAEADSLKPQPAQSGAIAPSASAGPAAAPPAAAARVFAPAENALGSAQSADRRAEAPGTVGGAVTIPGNEIVSPDPLIRWRIAGSLLERSTDGGARWDAVSTGIAAELTAGAAPSVSVCWVVGRGGVVLLSIDGRTWRRVVFPEVTDLSAVRATDARAAAVSTTDGRTFNTTDSGATWVRRP